MTSYLQRCEYLGNDWWRKSQRCKHPEAKFRYCKKNRKENVCPEELRQSTKGGSP